MATESIVEKIKRERDATPDSQVIIRRLSSVKAKNIDWLIYPMLAKGKMTIFHGEPGKGKSQASIYIAAGVSMGGVYIDGQPIEKGEVLFITAEDEASDTLKPRLMACGADVENIVELQWIINKEGRIKMFNLEDHISELKKAVAQLPNLKLIIIDPISAFLGKVDSNSGAVRGLFAELKPITEERGCALLIIAHHNKTSGMKALNKISGNVSFGAAARISYVFGNNPNNIVVEDVEEKFIMAQSKNNLVKEETNSQIYNIESAEVEEDGIIIKTSRIKWLGVSTMTSQEIVDFMPGKNSKLGRPNEKRQECIDEIINFMGEKQKLTIGETKVLKSHLLSLGFDEQMQRRVRQEIGINAIRIGNEPYWAKQEEPNLFNT
jgi:RecA-family ATPase